MSVAQPTGAVPSLRGRTVLVYGEAVALSVALVWLVMLAWWLLLPSARVVVLNVPAGTAASIARGEQPDVIPSTLLLRRGDTLAIHNNDVVVHRVGLVSVIPGTTARIPVDAGLLDGPSLMCSLHPSGAISISALARPGIESTIFPTLLAGIPVAISVVVALSLVRRLDRSSHAA